MRKLVKIVKGLVRLSTVLLYNRIIDQSKCPRLMSKIVNSTFDIYLLTTYVLHVHRQFEMFYVNIQKKIGCLEVCGRCGWEPIFKKPAVKSRFKLSAFPTRILDEFLKSSTVICKIQLGVNLVYTIDTVQDFLIKLGIKP